MVDRATQRGVRSRGRTLEERLPLKGLNAMLLGTDGVQELVAAADRQLFGKSERVGDIAPFWTEQHYFKHAEGLRRRLAVLNGEKVRPDWERCELRCEAGILPDDTTIAVIRNRRAPAAGWEARWEATTHRRRHHARRDRW